MTIDNMDNQQGSNPDKQNKVNLIEQFKGEQLGFVSSDFKDFMTPGIYDILSKEGNKITIREDKVSKEGINIEGRNVLSKPSFAKRVVNSAQPFSVLNEASLLEDSAKAIEGDVNTFLFEKYIPSIMPSESKETQLIFKNFMLVNDYFDYSITRLGSFGEEIFVDLLSNEETRLILNNWLEDSDRISKFVNLFFGKDRDDSRAKYVVASKVTTTEIKRVCDSIFPQSVDASLFVANAICVILEQENLLYIDNIKTVSVRRSSNESFSTFKRALSVAEIFSKAPFIMNKKDKIVTEGGRLYRKDLESALTITLDSLRQKLIYHLNWEDDLKVLMGALNIYYNPRLREVESSKPFLDLLSIPQFEDVAQTVNFFFWSCHYETVKTTDAIITSKNDAKDSINRICNLIDITTKGKKGISFYNKMPLETFKSFVSLQHHNVMAKAYATLYMHKNFSSTNFAGKHFKSNLSGVEYQSLVVDNEFSAIYNINLPKTVNGLITDKFHMLAADVINPYSNMGMLVSNLSTMAITALACSLSKVYKMERRSNEEDLYSDLTRKDSLLRFDMDLTTPVRYISPNVSGTRLKTCNPYEAILASSSFTNSSVFKVASNTLTTGSFMLPKSTTVLRDFLKKSYTFTYVTFVDGENIPISFKINMGDMFDQPRLATEITAMSKNMEEIVNFFYTVPISIARFMINNKDQILGIQKRTDKKKVNVSDLIFYMDDQFNKTKVLNTYESNVYASQINMPGVIRDYIVMITDKISSIPTVQNITSFITNCFLRKQFEIQRGKTVLYETNIAERIAMYARMISGFIFLNMFNLLKDDHLTNYIEFITASDISTHIADNIHISTNVDDLI